MRGAEESDLPFEALDGTIPSPRVRGAAFSPSPIRRSHGTIPAVRGADFVTCKFLAELGHFLSTFTESGIQLNWVVVHVLLRCVSRCTWWDLPSWRHPRVWGLEEPRFTRRRHKVPCVFVLRVRDGQIIESRDYIDPIRYVHGMWGPRPSHRVVTEGCFLRSWQGRSGGALMPPGPAIACRIVNNRGNELCGTRKRRTRIGLCEDEPGCRDSRFWLPTGTRDGHRAFYLFGSRKRPSPFLMAFSGELPVLAVPGAGGRGEPSPPVNSASAAWAASAASW